MPFTFNGANPDEVFRRLLSEVQESKKPLRIVFAHEPESSAAAGLIAKILRAMDADFEFISDAFKIPLSNVKCLGINVSESLCRDCVMIRSSGITACSRVGHNYVIKYTSLTKGILSLISELEFITRDFKLTAAAAMLTKHTPRLVRGELSNSEAELLKSLAKEGLLSIEEGPPLIGWDPDNPCKALTFSIDVLIPSKFMRACGEGASIEEAALEVKANPSRFKTKLYLVRGRWVSRDLILAAYMLDWLTDTYGASAVSLAMINQSYIRLAAVGIMGMMKVLREVIDGLDRGRYERVSAGGRRYVVIEGVNPLQFSARVAEKSMRSAGLINDECVVIRYENELYVPASSLPQSVRAELASRDTDVCGGYFMLRDLRDLSG